MQQTVIKAIASRLAARMNCIRDQARQPHLAEWIDKHRDAADELARDYLPSGSGFDSGTLIDWERSRPDRLVLLTGFHHMDENGMYSGWSQHTVTVRPSLVHDIDLRISGPDRDGIKEYIADAFDSALRATVRA